MNERRSDGLGDGMGIRGLRSLGRKMLQYLVVSLLVFHAVILHESSPRPRRLLSIRIRVVLVEKRESNQIDQ